MMMKIFLSLFYALFLAANAYAQVPGFLWAEQGSGSGRELGYGVAIDRWGNTIVTGIFDDPTMVFGTTTLTNSSFNGNEIFIVKYDVAGNVVWAKSAGGTTSDYSQSIAVDTAGNIFITGYFNSTAISFGSTILNNNGGSDVFLAKYDAAGNVLWARSAGVADSERANYVCTDKSGNVFITGCFTGSTISFGSTTLTNASSTGSIEDAFIAKYDSLGNVLWAERAGGTSPDVGISITADTSGNAIVTGYFESPQIIFGVDTFSSMGLRDVFISKYDPTGNLLWAKCEGGSSSEESRSISTDVAGNILLTGFFQSSTINWGTTTLSNSGQFDIFIVKYGAVGNLIWAKREGANRYDIGQSISADSTGNIFLAGYFYSSSVSFGTTTVLNADNSGSTPDCCIVKYDPSGNPTWALSFGGSLDDRIVCAAVEPSGAMAITGYYFSSTMNLGSYTLTNAASPGTFDLFTAKLDDFTTGQTEQAHLPLELKMSPNPCPGKFSMPDKGELIIYDAFGRIILQQHLSSSNSCVDLSSQPKGVYCVILYSGTEIKYGKIILE